MEGKFYVGSDTTFSLPWVQQVQQFCVNDPVMNL